MVRIASPFLSRLLVRIPSTFFSRNEIKKERGGRKNWQKWREEEDGEEEKWTECKARCFSEGSRTRRNRNCDGAVNGSGQKKMARHNFLELNFEERMKTGREESRTWLKMDFRRIKIKPSRLFVRLSSNNVRIVAKMAKERDIHSDLESQSGLKKLMLNN